MLTVKHFASLLISDSLPHRKRAPIESGRSFYSVYRKNAMANWTYRCYVDGQEPNLWRAWYDSHEDYQGQHDQVFEILEQLEQWARPGAKSLKKGLIEVRLGGSPKYRIFGFYGESKKQEFIVVATGFHKGAVYTPKEIIKTARKRMAEIKKDDSKANACKRPKSVE